ncbi:DUF192 domain-containing protein [Alterinioella nitratireducens]|uniref:DUF192 domain-containing protein n=1 Tax=Alterinioella nitratireducens TaxID=2735915 RepID=UPI000C6032F0|nr:DUF192 domain-containing protein [Alterinioella nitratireducens]MAN15615.1 hypothetical protein [Dinoroseobacter sp.]MAX73778.1 hypothetical protein [Nioella sp.]NPD19119.1 DUF192 domain-containing protein [Alterinioella nitratireducens]
MRSLRLGGLSLVVALVMAGQVQAACAPGRVELRGDWGTARFRVEVADDPEERAIGLMNREEMALSAGMLFVYDSPQRVSFWMENTLIPLDMLFLDATGTVTRVHENAVPLDRTPIPGGTDIQYVLEINGGLARQIGISEGDVLRHPDVDQDLAAWPCE